MTTSPYPHFAQWPFPISPKNVDNWAKWWRGELTIGRNGERASWQLGEMALGELAKGRNDEWGYWARWQLGKMVRGRNG
jgi:hypothetical protein